MYNLKKIKISLILGIFLFFPCFSFSVEAAISIDGTYEFSVSADGEATIIEYLGDTRYDEPIVVPDSIEGFPVVEIGEHAFSGCWKTPNITLPDSVRIIGMHAFMGCSEMESFSFPSSLVEIAGGAFTSCKNIEYLDVPDTVTVIEWGAFQGCTSLKSVKLPNTITTIGEKAFYECTSLESINIPENVTSIDTFAFESCTALTEITFPKSVEYIGYGVTYESFNLSSITVLNPKCEIVDIDRTFYDGATIYGVKNSTAYKYAQKYNRTFEEIPCEHEYTTEVIGPTCTSKGYTIYTCVYCETSSKDDYIAKKDHELKTTTTKATSAKNGKIEKTCKVCNQTISKSTIQKIKTTTLSTTSYTYNGKAKKPSVTVKDNKGNKLKSGTDYTTSYSSGRKNVGKYTVTIKFKGKYSGSAKKTFTIKPKSTSISKITSAKKGFKVTLKKQTKQTTGYQVQYSTDKNFKKGNKTVTLTNNSKSSKSISKLAANKKFYVRVRTYKTVKVDGKNTKIYSSWSNSKNVTTKK